MFPGKMMTEGLRRRALLGLAAIAGTSIPAWAQRSQPGGRSNFVKDAARPTKRVTEVPSDNRVYGVSSAAFEKYGYSPAVRAGGLLFVAGVVGVGVDGSVPDSIAEQAELAFERMREILRLEGLTMADLVDVVSYHVDIDKNLPAFMPIKARYFERPFPAWTILGVAALARPALKLEIRAIAAVRK